MIWWDSSIKFYVIHQHWPLVRVVVNRSPIASQRTCHTQTHQVKRWWMIWLNRGHLSSYMHAMDSWTVVLSWVARYWWSDFANCISSAYPPCWSKGPYQWVWRTCLELDRLQDLAQDPHTPFLLFFATMCSREEVSFSAPTDSEQSILSLFGWDTRSSCISVLCGCSASVVLCSVTFSYLKLCSSGPMHH